MPASMVYRCDVCGAEEVVDGVETAGLGPLQGWRRFYRKVGDQTVMVCRGHRVEIVVMVDGKEIIRDKVKGGWPWP